MIVHSSEWMGHSKGTWAISIDLKHLGSKMVRTWLWLEFSFGDNSRNPWSNWCFTSRPGTLGTQRIICYICLERLKWMQLLTLQLSIRTRKVTFRGTNYREIILDPFGGHKLLWEHFVNVVDLLHRKVLIYTFTVFCRGLLLRQRDLP